jgi:hypothetical protein
VHVLVHVCMLGVFVIEVHSCMLGLCLCREEAAGAQRYMAIIPQGEPHWVFNSFKSINQKIADVFRKHSPNYHNAHTCEAFSTCAKCWVSCKV